jgi:hypothetical protein
MLINFGTIWFAAGLAYAMKDTIRFQLPPKLERFCRDCPKLAGIWTVGQGKQKYGFGTCIYLDVLPFVPCTWCYCHWVPLAWLLAGMGANVGDKERWYQLIAFVSGLAAIIQASGMLTNLTKCPRFGVL